MGDVRGISLAAVRGFKRSERKNQEKPRKNDNNGDFQQSIVKNNKLGASVCVFNVPCCVFVSICHANIDFFLRLRTKTFQLT